MEQMAVIAGKILFRVDATSWLPAGNSSPAGTALLL
jgi:hypothetical protein